MPCKELYSVPWGLLSLRVAAAQGAPGRAADRRLWGQPAVDPRGGYRLGAEAVVTGELTEYINLHALELGLGVIETLHSVTEKPAVRRLASMLQAHFPDLAVHYIESGARRALHVV
jgi:hypothetical protein